ncbi:fumarylacetoacetate hydrolase family protein [Modestobacter roseus]|uniref:2-keto-4-pentenoate hydratase/2-oxohepta-3-ene-1,7-dioic acid hydratase in catechol pathway n=1 Tax=Modestobacter roseus TaxID=1181884 RepID=A0A562IR61_9ACTN|nr:fumarylacetoacetate hydrolase family protein [Modestobacter roseus]MQA32118.1 hydroxylase [Modestobacter roseus]TWH73350.1 2-keto-4-pentenoate hydratase/2-oxohepta-3-ene-1,7-dioic acid hydratase in catechol pathway [Modestobacter roseus]
MRFVTYAEDDGDRVGVLAGEQVHALPAGTTLLGLLRTEGGLAEAGERALASPAAVRPYAGLRLRAPLPDPPTVRDFMAFEEHVAGTVRLAGAGATVPDRWYEAPAFYFTSPYAVRGPHDDVPVPPGSELFDFELEVAAVIGRTGRDVHPADGESHIAGYTIMNDWSARDLQFAEMEVRLGPVKGKDTATTLGPVLVTPDEVEPWRTGSGFDLAMTVDVNGVRFGEDRWSSMAFGFGDLVAYASRGSEVRPGDVLGSGTCGNGCLAELWERSGLDAHPPLRAGDVVTVSVEQLGSITTRVVEGVAPVPVASARRHP